MWHNRGAFSFRFELSLHINFCGFISDVEERTSTEKNRAYFFRGVCVQEGNSCIEASSTHLRLLYGFAAKSAGLPHAV